MPTAVIYVFSGTNNTLATAKMIQDALGHQDVQTDIFEIKKPFANYPSPDVYDYAGFGYPVHAYNSPQVFLDFVKQLPLSPDKKAFVFKTSGEPFPLNKVSSFRLIKLLKNKGFDVLLEKHLLMPYNILFRYPDEVVKQMYLHNQTLSERLATALVSGSRDDFKFPLLYRLVSSLFRIEWAGAKLNGRLHSVNKKKCTLCMRCVKECPTSNISIKNGNIKFSGQCAMCMRCAMFCPKDAVNIGLIRFLKVNGAYQFNRILNDPTIRADYINADTKGFFRLFKKYYDISD